MTRSGDRWLSALGFTLLVAGVGVLGYVAWQFWGTNIVAGREHRRVTAELHKSWARGTNPVTGVGILRVQRFGRDFEVPIVRGFGSKELAQGVAMYPDGARPGQLGNVVLAGHRVTHGQPFRDFPSLRAGDTVSIETRTHVYTYRLRNSGTSITVDFSAAWPLWPVPDPAGSVTQVPRERLITLVTCSELFHTDNRQVVVGEQVGATSKPGG